MDSFIDDLECALVRVAQAQRPGRVAVARSERLRSRPALVLIAMTAAALVFGFSKASAPGLEEAAAAALPALAHADRDISRRAGLPDDIADGLDLHRAYEFAVPSGTAYVLASTDKRTVCVVLPDPPAGYGSTCATAHEVKQRGLVAELVAPSPKSGRSQVVVVLPAGVPAPVLRYDNGREQRLTVTDGVATATVLSPGHLGISAEGGTRTMRVRPFEPQGAYFRDCGDGRVVEIHSEADMAARVPEACR